MYSVTGISVFILPLIRHSLAIGDGGAVAAASTTHGDTVPSPLVVPPSQYFEGNDGPWSSFNLRVGTPGQDVRVLVSTASPETMVVLSEYGCSGEVLAQVRPNCAVSRGMMFNPNVSSTWRDQGIFGINQAGVGLEANLGYIQSAEFGLDTLGIGLVAGGNGPTLKSQTVTGIASASPFYLGVFGLNPQPVNFSTLGNFSSPSYMTSLKTQNLIPSLSWSYTAGAIYRLKQVYGQLIFSGYDESRFTRNSVSFTMAGDTTRDLVVALQAISYSGSSQTSLLDNPINIFIDSTDPLLWLPSSACEAFESAFGLTLDNVTGLYLVNDTHHFELLSSAAEVSFQLSDVLDGGETVTIVLPYRAFDLKAENPLVKNSSYYFPLKRAANESQYTLGRTFLQEAYLTVDYERGLFNVSQCSWVEGARESIITIPSRDSGPHTLIPSASPSQSSGPSTLGQALSSGAIAGIVIGALALVALLAGAVILLLRRRKASMGRIEPLPHSPVPDTKAVDWKWVQEHALETLCKTHKELGEDSGIYQLHGHSKDGGRRMGSDFQVHELAGSGVLRVELDASAPSTPVSR